LIFKILQKYFSKKLFTRQIFPVAARQQNKM
jgi:hypothetical protein